MARKLALRRLDRRSYSRAELTEYLLGKEVGESAVKEVMDRFEEVGLINDRAYAEMWVRYRHENRKLSKRAISIELRRKGVAEHLIDDALQAIDIDKEYEAARQLAVKKARSLGNVDRRTAYRRVAGVLARRGYPSSLVSDVVSAVLDEWCGD